MKWIKASERLPEKAGDYNLKHLLNAYAGYYYPHEERFTTPDDCVFNNDDFDKLFWLDEKDNPEQFSREDMKEAFENGNVLGWHRNEFKTFDKWMKEYLNSPEYLKAKG